MRKPKENNSEKPTTKITTTQIEISEIVIYELEVGLIKKRWKN